MSQSQFRLKWHLTLKQLQYICCRWVPSWRNISISVYKVHVVLSHTSDGVCLSMGALSEYPTPPPLRTPTYIHPLHLSAAQYFSIKLFLAAASSLFALPPHLLLCLLQSDDVECLQTLSPATRTKHKFTPLSSKCKCTLSQHVNKARGRSDFRCQCNVTSLHSRHTRFILHREKKEKVKDLPWGW